MKSLGGQSEIDAAPKDEDARFEFGRNWASFVEKLDEGRRAVATASLASLLAPASVSGSSFLDLGSGSGLFSLAAIELGASRVHSVDFDLESVACTRHVKMMYAPQAENWSIERGDVTDSDYCRTLGTFDFVYSWGVLHHTGAMWIAMRNACSLVRPGGHLALSIYNDQGRRSRIWRMLKKTYNLLPSPARGPFVILTIFPSETATALRSLLSGRLSAYLSSWRRSGPRGMSRWHDIIDWVGGYPFEVAKPEEVIDFCRAKGFDLQALTTVGGAAGCNQFVFCLRPPESVNPKP